MITTVENHRTKCEKKQCCSEDVAGIIKLGTVILIFQFARHDDFVPVRDAERYFELASEPKRIAWYDHCNHELSAQARLDRVIFLCEQFGLSQPSQELLQLL